MDSTLAQSILVPRSGATGRVLIVEPDGPRAGLLGRILRTLPGIELGIVPRVRDAIRTISDTIPDLVMTSPLLPPADERELWSHLRRVPGAAHVQVINAPYSIEGPDSGGSDAPRDSVLHILRRSQRKKEDGCAASALRDEVSQYLAQAVAHRDDAGLQVHDLSGSSTIALRSTVLEVDASAMAQCGGKDVVDRPDRRRATRRTADDLRGLWTLRLPWGSDGRLVDVSNSGVLFESPSKISPGVTVDLQILSEQRKVFVPARMVRTALSRVDASGVQYRMAAAFGREVRLVDFDAAVGLASPRVLTDLLARVLSDSDGPVTAADVNRRFEVELRRLLPRRDIRIRTTPLMPQRDVESIYFTLGSRAGSPRILQVLFESGSAPSDMEFKLLKTAANMAVVAFQIAEM